MEISTIFGTAAATLTTASFAPQLIKTIKTKETKDISLLMYSVYLIGIIMWLIYGIMLKEVPIIIANIITLILSGSIFVLKIIHG
jgi:MtN3 and saliva related transmembrane protein